MAVALRECIFDPMFEKSKCVCEVTDVLLNCKRTAEKFSESEKICGLLRAF